VPAVRFSRDKRGYEYTYLVHTPMRRGKPGRTRVLYWYRTPPGVRVGRRPFDADVQRLIEEQNPGVTFDWDAIINTPFPPPDMTEYWRERRRAEKAARQERRAQEAEEVGLAAGPDEPADEAPGPDPQAATTAETEGVESPAAPDEASTEGATADSGGARKKRRRRGGRRRRGQAADGATSAGGAPASSDEHADDQPLEDGDQSAAADPASEEP